MADCRAIIRRAPDNSLAYVRVAPGVANSILGYAPDGINGYLVLESNLDNRGAAWLRLSFTGGTTGWVSADRLDIQGDCTAAGYGIVPIPTQASTLPRNNQPPPPPPPPPSPPDTEARVLAASFNITVGFEGGGYDTYQNYDAGIVSYGRFGFTLASGSLSTVIDRYLSRAATSNSSASRLRTQYQLRIRNRDATLRNDTTLKTLLIAVAADPIMRTVQNEVATENYWVKVMDLSARPRNIVLALSQAFLFDTGINSGVYHDMITSAETLLGVPQRSRVPGNGITEKQLIAKVADIRHDRLYAIANAQNLPGLKPRADFWVNIIRAGDWNLQGDSSGNVLIKAGRLVQVKNP